MKIIKIGVIRVIEPPIDCPSDGYWICPCDVGKCDVVGYPY